MLIQTAIYFLLQSLLHNSGSWVIARRKSPTLEHGRHDQLQRKSFPTLRSLPFPAFWINFSESCKAFSSSRLPEAVEALALQAPTRLGLPCAAFAAGKAGMRFLASAVFAHAFAGIPHQILPPRPHREFIRAMRQGKADGSHLSQFNQDGSPRNAGTRACVAFRSEELRS